MTTFASTTSRVGAARDLSPRGPPRFFVPPSQAFLDQMVQFVDIGKGQCAPPGDRIHALEIPDALCENAADDFAPFDLGVRPHLPVQVLRDGEGDIRHGTDYVRAHNKPFRSGWPPVDRNARNRSRPVGLVRGKTPKERARVAGPRRRA